MAQKAIIMSAPSPGGSQLRTLNVGLVGAGKMAQHHARAILRVEGARVVAFADADDGAAAALGQIIPGATRYRNLHEILESAPIDVLHICTPPSSHELLAKAALEAGVHIYIEKPFVETAETARTLLAMAATRGLKVCAGHQLLFEAPAQQAMALMPALGALVHIESYFSFRTVRRTPGGRAPLRPDLQLLDILPHPVYLLLSFLETLPGETNLVALQVGRSGTVHALVQRGDVTGNLTVTLEGRPVESYVRLVGTNGAIYADFVRGTVQRHIGPGTSGIDKLVAPYRQAWQTFWGTSGSMANRVLKRQRSYPGLREIFEAFYASIRTGGASPVSPTNIEETVRICERVAQVLSRREAINPIVASPDQALPKVVLTGGTGFLGKRVARELATNGWRVVVLARRTPPQWEAVPGVEYLVADLGAPLDPALFAGARLLIHAAAETAGGWEDHERNSIGATENVIRAAGKAGVKHAIHVSSLAVLNNQSLITDDTPLLPDSRKQGPYVWGKLESERLASQLSGEVGMEVRIVRPGAIVDYASFEPPGRLGKRIGNWFVAVGWPGQRLGVVDLEFAAATLVWMAANFAQAPSPLNLLSPELPAKRDLLSRLRKFNPDLSVIWLPPPVLLPLSWAATLVQKLLKPGRPAMNVAKIFSVQRYDTRRIAEMAQMIEQRRTLEPTNRGPEGVTVG
jgi:predicted dehydrogenase/nucleoside-diphosphate-sugar epimerase